MAEFAISFTIIVDAKHYREAYDIQDSLRDAIGELDSVNDVADIDVEYLEGDLEEDEEEGLNEDS